MIKFILLGIIQGFTEFLPVSSSGHLVIAQRLLGVSGQEVILTLVLHLATVLALMIFFFKDILELMRNWRLLRAIIMVTIITGIIGVLGKDFFEALFSSVRAVAFALAVTGVILLLTRKLKAGQKKALHIQDAVILGVTQGIAIIPGISRSGMTISTLLWRKLDRESSFRLSFLVSIPAVLGASLLKAKEINSICQINLSELAVSFVFALVSGMFSLWILRWVMRKAKLYYFGYYCILIAIIIFLFIK